HSFVALAYRRAAASAVAPFSYLQILNSTLVGYLVFGAIPDQPTLAGAAIIAGSGLYIAQRARKREG
ncbi:MAG: DMT family transporter, partial [Acetobacteraceae bacterium]